MKLIRIIIIDGIPCIALPENILKFTKYAKDPTLSIQNSNKFLKIQQSKDRAAREKLMEELKEKFKEK
jgi:hypothetical protein